MAIAGALVLVAALQGVATTKQSLVGDAAYHLLAGHQVLRYGENRLNLEHPPLVKLVAALPLLAEAPLAEPITVDRVLETSQNLFEDPQRLHRVRRGSRLLVLLAFGFPWLLAAFFLGWELGGQRTGVMLAVMLGLSISALPYLSILQTDTAVALGFAVTLVTALRQVRNPSLARAAALGLGTGLTLAAKFSGVLILPTVAAALVLARRGELERSLRDGLVVGLVALSCVGTTYGLANRNYDSEAGRDTIARYCRGEALIVGERMKPYEAPLLAVERVSPGLAQWLTGLIGIRLQNEIGVYPTFAFGELRSAGRWWYFPAVLLVKTPIVVLLASFGALLATLARAREIPPSPPLRKGGTRPYGPPAPEKTRRVFALPFLKGGLGGISAPLLLGITAVVYLGVAMTSNYNLGVRHLLPVLPLLYLPAARWAAARSWRSALVVGVLALEALTLAPLWMSATNTWWLGRTNPTRFAFSIGDAEYRQNFIALADETRRRGVRDLRVLYPAVSEREIQAYLPDAGLVALTQAPKPGWYAVSSTLEQYLPAIPRTRPEEVWGHDSLEALSRTWEPIWREIVDRGEDHGYIASTFHLYRLP